MERSTKFTIQYLVLIVFIGSACSSTGKVNIVNKESYIPCEKGYIRLRGESGNLECRKREEVCSGNYAVNVYSDGDYICTRLASADDYLLDQIFVVFETLLIVWLIHGAF